MEKTLGLAAAMKLEAEGHVAHWQREAQSFLANRTRFAINDR